jgi:hypothetical protein
MLKKIGPLTAGDMVNQGLDGGTEFSFVVTSRDGGELLVSVVQTKEPIVVPPLKKSGKGNVVAMVGRRNAMWAEQQISQSYAAKIDRRRRRYLGEPV